MSQAMSDLNAIAIDLEKKYPQTNTARRVTMRPLFETTVGDYRASLNLLLAAVVCVLLIACANVANLQFARALARRRELAMRTALGPRLGDCAATPYRKHAARSNRRDCRSFSDAVEYGCDSGSNSAAAAALSRSEDRPARARFHHIRGFAGRNPRWRLAGVANLKFQITFARAARGRWPQRERWPRPTTDALRSGDYAGRSCNCSTRRSRINIEKFLACRERAARFRPTRRGELRNRIARREVQNPGAEGCVLDPTVAARAEHSWRSSHRCESNSPFDDTEEDSYFHVTGTPPVPLGQQPSAEVSVVSPDYFRLMGMPILRGRGFGSEDLPGEKGHSRSIIIDESFAQKYFAGKDPIGQHIDDNQTADEHAPPMTIIGVVPRTRNEAPGEFNVEALHLVQEYLVTSQAPRTENTLHVRTTLRDVAPLVAAVKRELQALDSDQPIGQITTMDEAIALSLATRRLTMVLLGAFAVLAQCLRASVFTA